MITELLNNEHGWTVILKVAHFVGLISLPGFFKVSWKNAAHRYYSRCVTVFTVLNIVSLVSNVLLYSIRDAGEFCQRSFECVMFLGVTLNSLYLRFNLEKLLRMVNFFQAVCIHHRNETAVVAYKRRERHLTLLFFVLMILQYTGLVIIVPNLNKSRAELCSFKKIYNWKNPQNTLPFFLYIPYIDPSDGKYYPFLYTMQAYWALLLCVQAAVTCANFALSPYSLSAHYGVLIKYAEMLGTVHRNAEEERILHKDIMKAEVIAVDDINKTDIMKAKVIAVDINKTDIMKAKVIVVDDINKTDIMKAELIDIGKEEQARVKNKAMHDEWYDYYYFRQLIQYHQKLIDIRRQLDAFFTIIWAFLTTLICGRMCIALYAILIPGVLPKFAHDKMVIEAMSFSVGCSWLFYGGEVLGSTVPSWRHALNQSSWYNCSRKTRRALPLVFLNCQREHYLSVKGLMPLNYSFMFSLIKTAYSIFNFLRIQNDPAAQSTRTRRH